MNHNLLLRNRFVMRNETFDVNFHRLPNIPQRLSLSFPLAVAASQCGTEHMITAHGFSLQNHGVVHTDRLLAVPDIVKFSPSRFWLTFLILDSTYGLKLRPQLSWIE